MRLTSEFVDMHPWTGGGRSNLVRFEVRPQQHTNLTERDAIHRKQTAFHLTTHEQHPSVWGGLERPLLKEMG